MTALAASAGSDIPLPEIENTASGRLWKLGDASARDIETLVQKAGFDPMLARVLIARGIAPERATAFLSPSLRETMPDPHILKDMDVAAKTIADAIIAGTGIGVFGDYDVDGTSAAALIRLYFDELGVRLPVYLPDRISEGYGPSIDAFLSLKEQGAETIITVDCGAAAHQPVNDAAKAGLSVVILDHHLMDGDPPAGAAATVNPNRPDDISGLTNLSASGVAFMAMVATNRELRERNFFADRPEPDLTKLLDLAALGLVCDVMDMKGLTRTLVAQGLKVMDGTGNAGLRILAERAGAKGKASAYHLGFLIGPRINAAGRIGHARLAFELMTTSDSEKRAALADKLHVMNAERQAIEADVLEEAQKLIQRDHLYQDDIIVAAGEQWHPGVIGIVAGRIREKFDKPAIIIGIENGTGKGSGRSMTGVDLGAAIASARADGLLTAGGGHMMAAGLTIEAGNIDALRARLNAKLSDDVQRARANRTLAIDAVVAADAVTASFAELIEKAGPFGPGNAEPVFALCDLRIEHIKRVGENHLSATFKNNSGTRVRAIAFRAADEPLGTILQGSERVHLAGKIRADDWRGGNAGQLQIVDAAPA